MRNVSDAYVAMSFMDEPSCSLKLFYTQNEFCIFMFSLVFQHKNSMCGGLCFVSLIILQWLTMHMWVMHTNATLKIQPLLKKQSFYSVWIFVHISKLR